MGGCVHILVNNAARFLEKPVQEIGVAEFEDLLRTNLVAPMLCTQIVLRHMPAGGHIVNIASTAALRGYALQSAYCAAKHGLLGFTRSLAEELKPRGIRVSALCPGGVRTEFIAGSEVAARIEGQAILEPGDVADLVRFVLTRPANVDMGEVTLRRFH
jgi:NAD(P)-dependent dehydrogenase (short-subunit alcohol dehydrogenase family)